MKLPVAVLVILFGAVLATAQNKVPAQKAPFALHPDRRPASSTRSVSRDAVAAVLNRKSTTAGDLAKIERGANQAHSSKPATTPTSVSKNFGVAEDNRNKPITGSKPGRVGHSSLYPKTKTR